MMRFLRLDPRDELTLTKNVRTPPGPYAILSHTWGFDDEEVTFDELENKTGTNKTGYAKLWFCANQSRKDGLDYFWVDTCCINKTSSEELSEAINSMYKWYQKATKCYVYMSDVSVMARNAVLLAECEWQSAFQSSTWFTRGWTLQELIAPKIVDFFSKEGTWLGDKSSLEQQIHKRTGVPVAALRGDVFQFDVKERLSWTAKRETTREEDAAYCLLGIVDIHMPLIYGEGRQKALARLQREIQISSDPAAWVAGCNAVPGTAQHQTPAQKVMKYEGFLKSLSFSEMEYRYLNIDDVPDDTCGWLLKHRHYQEWHSRAGQGTLLMIRGKPGSGKSTAIKRACVRAKERAHANEAILTFFFNSRGVSMESRLEGFFRSTLHQFLQSHYDEEAFTEWKRKSSSIKSGWTWTVSELQNMFVKCVRRSTVRITMFVDALDECESTTAARCLIDLLTNLAQNHDYDTCQSQRKFCVSSRHYPNVGVDEPLQIIVEKTNQIDIMKYTRTTLQRLVTDSEDLSSKITSRSEGIFLWALLVLEKIRAAVEDGEPRKTLYNIIDLVPRRLEELFQELIDSTPIDEREQRDLIIRWLLFAQRPLSLSELNHALAFRFPYSTLSHYETSHDFIRTAAMRRLLAKRTRGLVEVVEIQDWDLGTEKLMSTFRVQFIHEAVRQYILSQQNVIGPDSNTRWSNAGFAHNVLALSCFHYIKAVCIEAEVINDVVEQSKYRTQFFGQLFGKYIQDRPFLHYATRFGFEHAEVAEANGFPQSHLFESATNEASDSVSWWTPFTNIFRLYWKGSLSRYDDIRHDTDSRLWSRYITTQLAFACAFKLVSSVDYLLTRNKLTLSKKDLSKALCVTAVTGDEKTLALLTHAGADVNYEEPEFGSPLFLSLIHGRDDIIAILLEHGASVHRGPRMHSPFVVATLHSSVEIIRLLLTHGATVTECGPRQRRYHWSEPLYSMHALEAATHRNHQTMKLILDAAEHQHVPVEYYKTAFLSEGRVGKESIKSAITRLFPKEKKHDLLKCCWYSWPTLSS